MSPFRREPDPIKNAERALDSLDKNPDSPHAQRRADQDAYTAEGYQAV